MDKQIRRYWLRLSDNSQAYVSIPAGFQPLGGGGEIARLQQRVETMAPGVTVAGYQIVGEYDAQ
jgi:hypothetical protein